MTPPLDLEPAARRMAGLVRDLPDGALDGPTPCEAYSVGDLLHHVHGSVLAFTAAAVKAPLDGGPAGDASLLAPDWRTTIPRDLEALVHAWRNPAAWEGMTAAGGVDLPGEVAGVVALDELVLHGWDLARAIGRPGDYDGPELPAVQQMVEQFAAAGVDGLFGPAVAVPADAPLLHRILGMAGRDPQWAPPT
jgi:uncharacterized protein (TIGR03086 family)